MIRVIIVEDERIIRTGIKNFIKWEELGIGEVVLAENAEEALAKMQEQSFQIIISDICMPGMNGIELCWQYREVSPESQVIFISGFAEKEYLMAAISLGAVSFVEKPISQKVLTEAIRKALEALSKIRQLNSSVIHFLLNEDPSGESREAELPLRREWAEDECFMAFRIGIKNPIENIGRFAGRCEAELRYRLGDLAHFTVEAVEARVCAGLISCRRRPMPREAFLLRETASCIVQTAEGESAVFVSFGPAVRQVRDYRESYEASSVSGKLLASKGWNHYAPAGEQPDEYSGNLSEDQKEEFRLMLLKKDQEGALKFVREIMNDFSAHHYAMSYYIRNVCFELDRLILDAYRVLHLAGVDPAAQDQAEVLTRAETFQELFDWLQDHIRTVLSETESELNDNHIVRTAILFLKEHALESDVSVKMVADAVYLTPAYVSNLFKKKTGLTIGQYILDLRIRSAKEYLRDPSYKLYQIAQMVGYTDPNYFAKTFKKKTGQLPSEYRNDALNEK